MEISSKYNPKDIETKVSAGWLQARAFSAQKNNKKKPFSIVIPPPNITGILHMGHALNNTIQDVLIRFKRMQGYEALWMPGTDHAGIATQNVVEKDLAKEGLKKEELGREKFLKRLWAWQDEYGSAIIEQLKKLGASCDWQRLRFTMDQGYSEAVKQAFIQLYKKGLIYRGNYLINWCPRCRTALSDEEAAHREIDGWLYYIRYPVMKGSESRGKGPVASSQGPGYIVVATTRPETMLADTAVAVNPKDKRFSWLKKTQVILPIVERKLKVIEDEAVDPEFGTGIVKVTPAHDPVDFSLGKKHSLDFLNIMNDDASLNKNVPVDFIGLDRFEAREAVLAVLAEKKLIEKREPYKISAGHCYRCHTIIEPRISRQWFVKMKPLTKKAKEVVKKDKIKFYPQRWRKVYLNWMENIQDWCISRQIWWGHRLPVYYCNTCTANRIPLTESNIVNSQQLTVNEKGVMVSKDKPKSCPDCGSRDIIQDEDVLDTWFSSWLWPFATFGWPFEKSPGNQGPGDKKDLDYFYPTSVLVTGSEILFFWVARMIMAGLEFIGDIPFAEVIIHGTVRDERGIKMSKSLGNIIDPLAIIDKFGSDALRFSLMMLASSGSDVYLNEEKFLVGRNFANKIWNATRFIASKLSEENLSTKVLKSSELSGIDQWVLKELDTAVEEVTVYLENYQLNEAAKKIYDFFWHIFCDWYIEIVKDEVTAIRRKVLVRVLTTSLKLLHPYMPFITEEIFGLVKRQANFSEAEFLVNSFWPASKKLKLKGKEAKLIDALIETVKEIRAIKADLGINTQKVKVQLKPKKVNLRFLQANQSWLRRLSLLEDIKFRGRADKFSRVLYDNGLWELDLAVEGVDLANYISSLNKKIAKLETLLKKTQQLLANNDFLAKASAEKVAEEKNKAEDFDLSLKRLKGLRNAFKSNY